MNSERAKRMRSRAEWLEVARLTLKDTEGEIALFERGTSEWEAHFKTRWPGASYAATMRVQARRVREDIATAEAAQLADSGA